MNFPRTLWTLCLSCILSGIMAGCSVSKDNIAASQTEDPSKGYVTDIPYETYYIPHQSPIKIAHTMALRGHVPLDVTKPFTYLDLGTGPGHTLNMNAFLYPQADFWGIDLMPDHIAMATQEAQKYGLKNAHFIQGAFGDVDLSVMPQFDVITLHGVWSWVDATVQEDMLKIIREKLKPGGIVYISYNSYPGWAAYQPLSLLILKAGENLKGHSTEQFQKGLGLVKELVSLDAEHVKKSPKFLEQIAHIEEFTDVNYLVHEYMNKRNVPKYFFEIAETFAPLGIRYLGSADLSLNFPSLFLMPEQAQFLAPYQNTTLGETILDYLLDTQFRRDIFISTAIQSPPSIEPVPTRPSRFSDISVILIEPKSLSHLGLSLDQQKKLFGTRLSRSIEEILKDPVWGNQIDTVMKISYIHQMIEKGVLGVIASDAPLQKAQMIFQSNTPVPQKWRFSSPIIEDNLSTYMSGYMWVPVVAPALGTQFHLDPWHALCLFALIHATPGQEGLFIETLFAKDMKLSVPKDMTHASEFQKAFQSFVSKHLKTYVALGLIEPDEKITISPAPLR